MLRIEIKVRMVLLLSFFMFACNNNKHEEAKQKRMLYKKYSESQISPQDYNCIWNAAKDSIRLWANKRLQAYTIYGDHKWYLDSLLCFNKERDRCIMALSYQDDPESPSDGMDYFHGAKIKGKWYFFFGGGILSFLEIIINPILVFL